VLNWFYSAYDCSSTSNQTGVTNPTYERSDPD